MRDQLLIPRVSQVLQHLAVRMRADCLAQAIGITEEQLEVRRQQEEIDAKTQLVSEIHAAA